MIERIKAEAKFLSLNPNALAASGLGVAVDPAPYRKAFGENGFVQVAARWYQAILLALAERDGYQVAEMVNGEPRLVPARRAA